MPMSCKVKSVGKYKILINKLVLKNTVFVTWLSTNQQPNKYDRFK